MTTGFIMSPPADRTLLIKRVLLSGLADDNYGFYDPANMIIKLVLSSRQHESVNYHLLNMIIKLVLSARFYDPAVG